RANYTCAKALADSSTEGHNPENPTNRHFNYGPASFDRRHILVGTYSYQIPFARHWKSPAKYAFAGWQMSGINRFQSGPYYTVSGNTSIGGRRADYLGGSVLSSRKTIGGYLNPSAFSVAPNGRLGNSGAGIVQGIGLQLWDISLRKEFAVTERVRMKFQGDIFNVLNRANFRGLNTNLTDLAFGTITAAGPARNVQLGLKLQF